jgi:hypothetical protein
MTLDTYRILHLTGLIVMFFGLGGMLSYLARGQKAPKLYPILQGIGLLGLAVAGFGAAGVQHYMSSMPGWLIAKMGVWVLIGVLPFLSRRGFVPVPIAWLVALGLGCLAIWLAIAKPF